VPVAILTDPSITLADLKVYTALSSFQGSNDDAYPSREAIVARCGLVVETVSRSVKHLMELGWIQRYQRGLRKTNVYRVMIESDISEVTHRSLPDMTSTSLQEVTHRSLPSIELEKNTRKRTSANASPFTKPSLDELKAYCNERKNSVNPEKWLAHYESVGWKIGRNPMKDWKAAVRTWEHNSFDAPKKSDAPAIAKDPLASDHDWLEFRRRRNAV